VTASSQTPPGALPPELSPGRPPLPHMVLLPATVAAGIPEAPAQPDLPHRLRSPFPEPTTPECCMCGTGPGDTRLYPDPSSRRYPSGAQVLYCGTCVPDASPVQAATGVITAAMEHGPGTPCEIAQAEQDAGLLFDPQRAKDIEDAAREQARAEYEAELVQLRQDVASLGHFKGQLDGIRALLAGRPDSDLMLVREILAAADSQAPLGAPLVLTWDGDVRGPSGDTENENTLVPCTASHGGPAVLVLDDERRQELAALLDLRVRDIREPCPTPGCGTDNALDATNPFLFGWSRLEIATLGDGPRWYCSDMCVFGVLARAGHELADADRQAEMGGVL